MTTRATYQTITMLDIMRELEHYRVHTRYTLDYVDNYTVCVAVRDNRSRTITRAHISTAKQLLRIAGYSTRRIAEGTMLYVRLPA